MHLKKPPFAKPGDTIGVYAPSSGIETPLRDNYERGKRVLLDRGYQVQEAVHTHEWKSHYSTDGASKASDLMDLQVSQKVVSSSA